MDHAEASPPFKPGGGLGSQQGLSGVIRINVPTSFGKGRKRAVAAAGSGGDLGAAPSSSSHLAPALTPTEMGGLSSSSYNGFQKPTLRVRPLAVKMWAQDSTADCCQAPGCKQVFSMFTRKHHCRSCGFIFCGNCSSNFLPVETPPTSSNTMPATGVASSTSCSSTNNTTSSTTAATTNPPNPAGAEIPHPQGASARLCQSCYCIHQLVVHRLHDGKRRKKSCGHFKRLPATILTRFAEFLSVEELQTYALVSGEFYFASRDNKIWTNILAQHGWTEISSTRVNSPFNYTSFLSYVQRQTHEQCAGIASFASGLRELLSGSVKVCIVGPPGVGKTAIVDSYCGEGHGGGGVLGGATRHSSSSNNYGDMAITSASPGLTSPNISKLDRHGSSGALNTSGGGGVVNNALTIGMTARRKRTALTGALSTETTISVYDTDGGDRYGWIRNIAASCSHAVVLCYDAHSKVSLVKAALLMEEIEPHLTGQTVVVCGVIRDRSQKVEVNVRDAEAATVRCGATVQVLLSEPNGPNGLFGVCVQAVIDRIATTFTPFLPVPTVLDVLLQ